MDESLEQVIQALKARLAREPEVEPTVNGKFICKFVDFNNPNPSSLVGDTEEIAYRLLLSYLKSKEVEQQT